MTAKNNPVDTNAVSALISDPGVEEHLTLRSRIGFMAFHGGSLEKVTDIVASEAAELAGCSYYGLVQSAEDPTHLPSTDFAPSTSTQLKAFFDHVHTVITIHGYGRQDRLFEVLMGGRNRALANHLAAHLRVALPQYVFHTDMREIPKELAGQNARNPVNIPVNTGVQIELSPGIRWNREGWGWSDQGDIGRASQVTTLIGTLAAAARAWPSR